MFDPAALFHGLADARGLVLAVSGGPDSTALLHLAALWRAPRAPLWVASVDHGLQDGSRDIADAVVARAADLGLPGRVLTWRGDKPTHGIQAKARAARYRLLGEFCREFDASHLVLAHTLDDQAETLLMRLAAGSGLRGLAGMRALTPWQGIVLARPLLATRRDELHALCLREGWTFFIDPSNADLRFARVRWRGLAPVLAAEGLTPERMRRLAERLARADAALEHASVEVAARAALAGCAGMVAYDAPLLLSSQDEVALRVLASALERLCPGVPSRLERLETLLAHLQTACREGRALRRTLQGCLISLDASGRLTLQLEPARRRGRCLDRRSDHG